MRTRRGNSEQRNGGPSAREAVPLKEYLSKRLAAYAAAAGAAGVGLLAMAEPAKADIIYTPTNLTDPSSIDLNHDGINDFNFIINVIPKFSQAILLSANGRGNPGWGILCMPPGCSNTGYPQAVALHAGSLIGPGRRFANPSGRTALDYRYKSVFLAYRLVYFSSYFPYYNSPFANSTNLFMGLRFSLDGQAHYGWAGLSVSFPATGSGQGPISFTISGYAYETNANQSILAGQTSEATPEPGTLGLLALGSLGLGFWRRRKQEPVASDK